MRYGNQRLPIRLRNYTQRFQARKVAVVSDERVGIDGKSGGGLHRIGQFETQRRTQPRRTAVRAVGLEKRHPLRLSDLCA